MNDMRITISLLVAMAHLLQLVAFKISKFEREKCIYLTTMPLMKLQ